MVIKKTKETILKDDVIKQINGLLLAGEPDNISVDERAGYTGYSPQAVIDAVNSVVPIDQWGFDEISSEVVMGKVADVVAEAIVESQIKVWIHNRDNYRMAWGQGRITRGDRGDARKSAQTDGLKKALSYFSIGNRAYLGILNPKSTPTSSKLASPDIQEEKPATKPVETITDTVEVKYINTPAGSMLSRAYFAAAKSLGIDSDKAHDLVTKKFNLESYTNVTKEQLQASIQALNKKKEAKEMEDYLKEFDGELPK